MPLSIFKWKLKEVYQYQAFIKRLVAAMTTISERAKISYNSFKFLLSRSQETNHTQKTTQKLRTLLVTLLTKSDFKIRFFHWLSLLALFFLLFPRFSAVRSTILSQAIFFNTSIPGPSGLSTWYVPHSPKDMQPKKKKSPRETSTTTVCSLMPFIFSSCFVFNKLKLH